MATILLGCRGGILIDIIPHGQIINSDLYIQNLKSCKSISGEFNLTKMLLKSSFNVTMHNHTQVLKCRKQSQNLDGLFLPTHHTTQILLLQICASLASSKTPPLEGLAVRTRLFKKQKSGCKYKIQPGTKKR